MTTTSPSMTEMEIMMITISMVVIIICLRINIVNVCMNE